MSSSEDDSPLYMEAKGHIDPAEQNRRDKLFQGHKKSEVNEVLCALVERRFSTIYRFEDHRGWVKNTFKACKGRYGQDSDHICPDSHTQVYTAYLYLPTEGDTPREEHLVMTRTFEGMMLSGRRTVDWLSNTDQYHESGGTRTVIVSSEFDPGLPHLTEFKLEGAERDSLQVVTERNHRRKVATVTYTDRDGNTKIAIPPAFLQPIETWAESFGYTIETPNIVEGSVGEDIASAAE